MTAVLERRGELELLHLDQFDELGADVVVTTRIGGVSAPPYDTLNLGDHVGDDADAVAENRRRLATALGVGSDRLVLVRQVHGTTAIDAETATGSHEADALVTTDAAIAVAVLVADCVPLVALDPDARVLAVVHAGWRGAARGIVPAAITAMTAHGAVTGRLRVAMGPCIGASTYQVGEEVADALGDAGCADAVTSDGTGRFLADLALACRSQLVRAGVDPASIDGPFSTTDVDPLFFSDRARRPCGRFALAARLTGRAS